MLLGSLVAIGLLPTLSAASGLRSTIQTTLLCRCTVVHTMLDDAETAREETACIPILDGIEQDDLLPFPLPQQIRSEENLALLEEGHLFIEIQDATLTENTVETSASSTYTVVAPPSTHRQRQLQSTGTQSIHILRVSTTDVSPTYSLETIEETLFGNHVNLKSQYDACSFGQLQWEHTGSMDVLVDQPIASFVDSSALITAVQQQLKSELSIDAVSSLADKVLMCLPSGTGNWIASAAIGHWRAQFNDEWCLSLTATMHELGHTMGLTHANKDGQEYADSSGYMAAGHLDHEWPRKCFNGEKNWKLGWYSSRTESLDLGAAPLLYNLAAFVDYDKTVASEPVLINVADSLFVQYNRAKGFNVDTEDKQNMITITETQAAGSNSRGGLAVGDQLVFDNFNDSGSHLVIEACQSRTGSNAETDVMVVSVGFGASLCGSVQAPTSAPVSPTRAPTPSPTKKPTNAPTKVPTPSPTRKPTIAPTVNPTIAPTANPTNSPTKAPTSAPVAASSGIFSFGATSIQQVESNASAEGAFGSATVFNQSASSLERTQSIPPVHPPTNAPLNSFAAEAFGSTSIGGSTPSQAMTQESSSTGASAFGNVQLKKWPVESDPRTRTDRLVAGDVLPQP